MDIETQLAYWAAAHKMSGELTAVSHGYPTHTLDGVSFPTPPSADWTGWKAYLHWPDLKASVCAQCCGHEGCPYCFWKKKPSKKAVPLPVHPLPEAEPAHPFKNGDVWVVQFEGEGTVTLPAGAIKIKF